MFVFHYKLKLCIQKRLLEKLSIVVTGVHHIDVHIGCSHTVYTVSLLSFVFVKSNMYSANKEMESCSCSSAVI